jgi:pimeloyl-ACP methyl ester carboxylesterase
MAVDLSYTESGQGIPLVLLHAFPMSSAMWQAQHDGLGDVCRVITPDQRGFGESPLADDEPSLDHVADDVATLLDRLGLQQVVLGGLSMGGYVAMAVLRRHADRVAGLVLADTKAGADAPEGRERRERLAERVTGAEGLEAVYADVVPPLLGRTSVRQRPEVVARVRDIVSQCPVASIAWASRAMAARPDSRLTLAETAVPSLVLVGDEDTLTPAAEATEMADLLPNVQMARLMAAGHLSAMEDPAAFNAAVRDFVTQLT